MSKIDDKSTATLRTLSNKVIWLFSKELVSMSKEPCSAFELQSNIHELSKCIEWLSAIVCDDWRENQLDTIYEELKEQILPQHLISSELWIDLCRNISNSAGNPPVFGKTTELDTAINHQQYQLLGLRNKYIVEGFKVGKVQYIAQPHKSL